MPRLVDFNGWRDEGRCPNCEHDGMELLMSITSSHGTDDLSCLWTSPSQSKRAPRRSMAVATPPLGNCSSAMAKHIEMDSHTYTNALTPFSLLQNCVRLLRRAPSLASPYNTYRDDATHRRVRRCTGQALLRSSKWQALS